MKKTVITFLFLVFAIQIANAQDLVEKLFDAVRSNDLVTVKKLVQQKKVNINEYDKNGESVLNTAVLNGNMKMIEFLVKNGADVNLKNEKSVTPIMTAAMKNDEKMIDFLINKGGNPDKLIPARIDFPEKNIKNGYIFGYKTFVQSDIYIMNETDKEAVDLLERKTESCSAAFSRMQSSDLKEANEYSARWKELSCKPLLKNNSSQADDLGLSKDELLSKYKDNKNHYENGDLRILTEFPEEGTTCNLLYRINNDVVTGASTMCVKLSKGKPSKSNLKQIGWNWKLNK